MNTIFMNSEKNKINDSHKLFLNLTGKIDLRRSDKYVYQILAFTAHGKIQKSHTKTINLNYLGQRGMDILNCLMDHILYQISKIILNIFKKTWRKR